MQSLIQQPPAGLITIIGKLIQVEDIVGLRTKAAQDVPFILGADGAAADAQRLIVRMLECIANLHIRTCSELVRGFTLELLSIPPIVFRKRLRLTAY